MEDYEIIKTSKIKGLEDYSVSIHYSSLYKEYRLTINKDDNKEYFISEKFTTANELSYQNSDYIYLKCVEIFGFKKENRPLLLKHISLQAVLFEKYKIQDNEKTEKDIQYFIQELQDNETIDDKEKIMKLLKYLYSFYADATNPNLPVYYWTKKIWNTNIETIILKELYNLFGDKKTKVSLKEVNECLKGKGQQTKIKPKPPHLVVINNGIFDLDTQKLLPHSKEYFYVNIIPHNYNKEAEYPNWLKFEKEIHDKGDLDFIQEFFGYCLYTGYPVKAFLMLLGTGDNGKSIELIVLKNVIGRKNNTSVTLQQLNYNNFSVAELYQKLTNISDDISNVKITKTGSLKTITDGGEITAERKYGQPFDFPNYAKIINSANIPPEIEDESEGIWNRLKAVFYPYKFVDTPIEEYEKKKIDKEKLLDLFEKEYEGILNWMLEGLTRLRKNNFVFSYNKGTKEVHEYYKNISNPSNAWINKELEYVGDNEEYIFKSDIYNIFVDWINRKGIKPLPTKDKFFKELRKSDIIDSRVAELDFVRAYMGYKINKEETGNVFLGDKND